MTFKKGKSGNPGGMSKDFYEVLELARKHSKDAINTIVELMTNGGSESIKLAAAEIILDRGIGKPSSAELDIALITDERLLEEIRRRHELYQQQHEPKSLAAGLGDS